MVGQVLAEILQVLRGQEHEDMRLRLSVLPYLEMDKSAWFDAARLSAELRAKGLTTPLSDLVIAVLAIKSGLAIYATDPHFARVPGLKRHEVPT
jgi:predicted nucleic acid-binding protein